MRACGSIIWSSGSTRAKPGEHLRVQGLVATKMACLHETVPEQAFFDSLAKVVNYRVE
jgi:heat shock protein HslJ